MMEVVCREIPIEQTHRKRGDFIRNIAIRISTHNRHLITLDVLVWSIVGEIRARLIDVVHDARIFHLEIGWGLKIHLV